MAKFKLAMGDISSDIKLYNKAYIDDFSCTSQISTDASSVNYCVLPATGSAKMRDINDRIKTDIENGGIGYSGQKTNVLLNYGNVQELVVNDSTYDVVDRTLNVDFNDRLSVLDSVTYGGMPLRDKPMTAFEMLDDVIGSYGEYVKTQVANWTPFFHKESFTIWSDANGIECDTASGWEIIGTPIKVIKNKEYNLYYDIQTAADYTTAIPLQVLSGMPTESSCEALELARVLLPTTEGTSATGTLTFTPTTDVVYLVLNFGYADDGQKVMIAVDNLNINGNSIYFSTYNPVYVTTWEGTVLSLLANITITYPYLKPASYRETLEKFCTLAQLTVALDKDGRLRFYDARPLRKGSEKAINVSRAYQTSNLNKTLFLKNKYDGVSISQSKVNDNIVVSDNIYNWDSNNGEYTARTDRSGVWLGVPTYIDVTYFHGSLKIPKKSNDNLTTINRLSRYEFSVSGTHRWGTIEYVQYDGGSGYRANYTNSEVASWDIINKFSESNASGSSTVSVTNRQSFEITTDDDYYTIDFYIPVGQRYYYCELYAGNVRSELHAYVAEKLSISFYGDKREISFEEVDLSTAGIESAKTIVSIPTNELMQNESDVIRVRDNIIKDYANGIPTATVDLFCGVKQDFDKGDIVQPNDILRFEGDDNLWRVTSRTFNYKGSPTVRLELQAQTIKT